MIELYTAPTPNGHKASCTLEALELEYETHFVNISEGEQKLPGFLAINPNGRIPAIVDRELDNFPIFESGASVEGLDNLNRWLEVMRDQPGMSKGIEVPFSLGNLLDDEAEQKKFTDNAQSLLQK